MFWFALLIAKENKYVIFFRDGKPFSSVTYLFVRITCVLVFKGFTSFLTYMFLHSIHLSHHYSTFLINFYVTLIKLCIFSYLIPEFYHFIICWYFCFSFIRSIDSSQFLSIFLDELFCLKNLFLISYLPIFVRCRVLGSLLQLVFHFLLLYLFPCVIFSCFSIFFSFDYFS